MRGLVDFSAKFPETLTASAFQEIWRDLGKSSVNTHARRLRIGHDGDERLDIGRAERLSGATRDEMYAFAKMADEAQMKSDRGELKGRVLLAPLKPGNLQVHWPEGNVRLDRDRKSQEGVSDYNAVVRLEKL